MIRRVSVKNYKSLKNIDLQLGRLAVIMGPNAAGKSNLFDAIHLLSRLVTKRNISEAFEDHRGNLIEAVHYDQGSISDLLTSQDGQHAISFSIDVEIGKDVATYVEAQVRTLRRGMESDKTSVDKKAIITNPFLRYDLTLEILAQSGQVRIKDERLTALRKDGKGPKTRNPFIEKTKNKITLRMEGQAHPSLHDLGLDYTIVSTPLYAPHYPHITAFKEEMSRCHFYYFEPSVLMRSANPIARVQTLGPRGEDLAGFYHTLQVDNPKQFKAIELAARSLLPNLDKLEVQRTEKGELYLQIREKYAAYSNRLLSEGTLRVLGLLAVLSPTAQSTTIGYEEPENGVHPRRLETIADLIKNSVDDKRQVIINTHSPILPLFFGDKDLIICRREGGSTKFLPFPYGPLYRKNEIDLALTEQILRGEFGG